MKVQINTERNTSFHSGLTHSIEQKITHLNVNLLEKQMFEEYGIDAKFDGNQAIAGCFAYVINICNEACQKYGLPFSFVPPSIRTFDKNNFLYRVYENLDGFCLYERAKILQNDRTFDTGSIFIRKFPNNINFIDKFQERKYNRNHSPTSHFLGLFLHEYFHNIHYGLMNEKFVANDYSVKDKVNILDKNAASMPFFQKLYTKFMISEYASTSYYELFSDIMTKLIIKVLDKESMTLKRNPLDNLKKYPRFIEKFIEEQLN